MKAKILVIQDNDPVIGALSGRLEGAGHDVDAADLTKCPVQTVKDKQPHLVIIDWMLPNIVDIDLCRQIRSEGVTPDPLIMMLSECGGEAARLRGFEAGADDYIVKPVSLAELQARVNAMLRRAPVQTQGVVQRSGEFTIDQAAHRITRGKRRLKLGPVEYRLLAYFMDRPGRILSRRQLLENCWDDGASTIDERTVDVHIGRLRKAIMRGAETDPIRTVRSEGYIFDAES